MSELEYAGAQRKVEERESKTACTKPAEEETVTSEHVFDQSPYNMDDFRASMFHAPFNRPAATDDRTRGRGRHVGETHVTSPLERNKTTFGPSLSKLISVVGSLYG